MSLSAGTTQELGLGTLTPVTPVTPMKWLTVRGWLKTEDWWREALLMGGGDSLMVNI